MQSERAHISPARAAETRPQVTVVITTYNRHTIVSRAVDSVLQQSFKDWDLVIVDDGSSIPVDQAIEPYSRRSEIKLVKRDINGGVSAARNTGLDWATGEFVCFLDDDDTYLSHKLARQVPLLQSSPDEVVAVFGRCLRPTGDLLPSPNTELSRMRLINWAPAACPNISTLLFRTELIKRLRFDEALPAYEDWDLYARILKQQRIIPDEQPEPVSCWRQDGANRLTAGPVFLTALEGLYEKYRAELARNSKTYARWRNKLAFECYYGNKQSLARRHLIASLRTRPQDPKTWYMLAASIAPGPAFRSLMNFYTRLSKRRSRTSESSDR